MNFNVQLRAFQGGIVRTVNVPDVKLTGETNKDLDLIFKYGQNDFQPIYGKCSVSAGDLIEYNGEFYLIEMIGFTKTCNCGSGEKDEWFLDARDIPLVKGCSKCKQKKLSKYRPDVLTDSNYWADEPIEPED